jgi:hypothetical protein
VAPTLVGGITAADEDSNPGIEEFLDPIQVADGLLLVDLSI